MCFQERFETYDGRTRKPVFLRKVSKYMTDGGATRNCFKVWKLHMCTHVYTRIHTHTHVYTCIHLHAHVYAHVYSHTYTHIISIHMSIHTYTRSYTYAYTHAFTHFHTHVDKHVHAHVHTRCLWVGPGPCPSACRCRSCAHNISNTP